MNNLNRAPSCFVEDFAERSYIVKTAGSVTNWLRNLEQGDEDAAHRLWERYSAEMTGVAKRRMRRLKRHDIVDEEDIVVSAFAALCLAARNGQLAGIANRDELWAMMIVITNRNVGHREQYARASKRDAGSLLNQAERRDKFGSRLQRLVSDSTDPAEKMQLADAAEQLLAKLDDADLRAIAMLKSAGYTIDEIATEMGYARRTVQRMLSIIRSCWESEEEV